MPAQTCYLRIATIIIFTLTVISVFLLSWKADPNIGNLSIFPSWIGKWINNYGNLRTSVPFIILGFTCELNRISVQKVWKCRIINLIGLFIIILLAELGQLLLPLRHFDYQDIFCGMAGSIVGMLAGNTAKKIFAVD